jgi:hypothetical protein
MRSRISILIPGILIQSIFSVSAQVSLVGGGPYTLITSATFDTPKGQEAHNSLGYGKNGIIQVNSKDAQIISFQKFSSSMKPEGENSIDIQSRITGRLNMERAIVLKTKSYIFLRDVKKDPDVEGITALELFPDKLDLSTTPVPLFQSSGGVIKLDGEMYKIILSKDKSKFLCSYKVRSGEKSLSTKEFRGVYAFDENLNKLWGAEYEMPYASKDMLITDVKLASDGTAYFLIWAEGHYEALVFQADGKTVKQIEIKDKDHLMVEAYLDESPAHEMMVISTCIEREPDNGPLRTADSGGGKIKTTRYFVVPAFYTARTAATGICIGKIKNDQYIPASPFYDIPADVVKLDARGDALDNIKKDEAKGLKPATEDLMIRGVYYTPDGSTKIVTEVNELVLYDNARNGYGATVSNGGDIIVFSINVNGKMDWIKKIRKDQVLVDNDLSSINVICKGNELHLFFLDNIPNESDTPSEVAVTGTFLKGVSVDQEGKINRYTLGKIWALKNRFYIRRFTDGGNNNLIENSRDAKGNKLFSIQVN